MQLYKAIYIFFICITIYVISDAQENAPSLQTLPRDG